jgi:hypothetical protein
VNTVGRLIAGVKSVIANPTERHIYAARLKRLARGSAQQTGSPERRRGLTDGVVKSTIEVTLMRGTSRPAFLLRESISWPFESILSHGLGVPHPKHVESKFTCPAVAFPSATTKSTQIA